MKKNKSLVFLKMLTSFILLFFLILEIQRTWSDFPSIKLTLTSQEASYNVFNISYYWKEFAQFGYFTVLSNIIIVIPISLSWILKIKIKSGIRASVQTYSMVTTIIFWIFLAPILKWNQSPYYSFIIFYDHIIPTMIGFFWTKEIKRDFKIRKETLKMSVFPIMYLCFAIVFYITTNGHIVIYPFLNFENFLFLNLPTHWSIVLSTVFVVFIAFFFIFIFYLISRFAFKNPKVKLSN